MIIIRSGPVYYTFIFLVITLIGGLTGFPDGGWVAHVAIAALMTAVVWVVLDLVLHVKWGR